MRAIRNLALFVSLIALAGCQQDLYTGLSQRDALDMVAVLTQKGIRASSAAAGNEGTYKITVDDKDYGRATEILKSAGYPKPSYKTFADLFPGTGLIVSPYEQRIRFMYALDQELAKTISDMNGVVDARVHVVVPELDLRGRPVTNPSASVVIHTHPHADTFALATKIRLVVANAVQGLNYKDVAIAFFPGGEADNIATSSMNAADSVPAYLTNSFTKADDSASSWSVILWTGAFLMAVVGLFLSFRKKADRSSS